MSLRTTVLRQSRSISYAPVRALSSSAPRRAGHGHDDHSHGHGESSEANTTESEYRRDIWIQHQPRVLISLAFLSPTWRNTFILVAASVLAYPYLPSPSSGSSSPSLSPAQHSTTASPASEARQASRPDQGCCGGEIVVPRSRETTGDEVEVPIVSWLFTASEYGYNCRVTDTV
jgi:hypothetical protein